MISTSNLCVELGSKRILNQLDIEFESGKINLILGANGAGKSTLIHALSGQILPKHGEIFYADKRLSSLSTLALAQCRAVLSQNTVLAFPLKVREVVNMGRYPHFATKPNAYDKQACQEAMELFDVLQFAERNYLELSGGEKQRVQFARVLAQIWLPPKNGKRYLFLDEPLTFLDVQFQYQFMQQLKKLAEDDNLTLVGVVHDLNLAVQFADDITLLHAGKILAKGKPKMVLTEQNIETVFQLKVKIHEINQQLFIQFKA